MKIKSFCLVIFLFAPIFFAQSVSTSAYSDYVLPLGKTLFANVDKSCILESANPKVAGVCGRLVNTSAMGTTKIFVKKNGTVVNEINVTVGFSEGVKNCYSTPNNIYAGNEITLTAVTDKTVEGVKFVLCENGNKKETIAQTKTEDGNNFLFSGSLVVDSCGKHRVYAEFLRDGKWNYTPAGENFILVNRKNENAVTEKRVSDLCINYIARKEGFHGGFAEDKLVTETYDIGYGSTATRGSVFYNNITRKEAFAGLVNLVNNGVYSRAVNDFILKNKIKCSQNQFDALVSFTYNLGSRWLSSSSLKDILLKSGGGKLTRVGRVTSDDGLNLREKPSCNDRKLQAMRCGEEVEIVGEERYNGNWLKVKTSRGAVGYCCADFLSVTEASAGEKDLKNVNSAEFTAEMLQYHHAGGKCWPGLLYRRIEEVQMFLYGDYSCDGSTNKHGFACPKCILPIL